MSDRRTREELLAEISALRRELETARGLSPSPPASSPSDDGESAERYRSVVDTVVEGIISIDDSGLIQSFNPAAEKIFGYPAEDVIGQNVSLLMPAPEGEQHDGHLDRYLRTGKKKIIGIGRQVIGRRKNGTTFPMEIAVGQFQLGSRRMFTGVVRDISEQEQLEHELRQAQRMESIGQLAGGVAHDFNNQLGIILFDVDMLIASAGDDGQLKEDLQKIRKVVLRSADLTRQLLVFSRRQRIEPQPLDLNRQVRELQTMVGRLLGTSVQVELCLSEDLCMINADPGNMDQIVINLCVNARDAMPTGGKLTIRTRRVVVAEKFCQQHALATPGSYCVLEVADTGIGMDEGVKARMFEPFFTTKETGKGTGLGLSVVYGIVESHKGCIIVESSPEEGSRFEIYMPLLEGGIGVGEARPEAVRPKDRRRGQGECILFLEDQEELRERTERALVDRGFTVTACASVAEGRAACKERATCFDLVLCDIVLPDGRGPDFVAELLGENPSLPAIFVTGYAEGRHRYEQVGDSEFPVLQKPFDVNDLLDRVHDALGRAEDRSPRRGETPAS